MRRVSAECKVARCWVREVHGVGEGDWFFIAPFGPVFVSCRCSASIVSASCAARKVPTQGAVCIRGCGRPATRIRKNVWPAVGDDGPVHTHAEESAIVTLSAPGLRT